MGKIVALSRGVVDLVDVPIIGKYRGQSCASKGRSVGRQAQVIPEHSSAADQQCGSTKSYVKSVVTTKYLMRTAEMATVLIILIIRRPEQCAFPW